MTLVRLKTAGSGRHPQRTCRSKEAQLRGNPQYYEYLFSSLFIRLFVLLAQNKKKTVTEHMAITREKKVEVKKTIEAALKEAESVVFVNFKGLGVTDATNMRQSLRDKGVGYYVAKKTLIKSVLADKKYAGELPPLEGEIALAYSLDPTTAAREVHSFVKDLDGKVTIVGGIFEGAYRDMSAMTEIALIPSRETLLAQFVNIINSPIQGFASVLHQIAEQKA
jgi:large subunit ribosomal protein L10